MLTKLHWDILDERRKQLLPKLAFLKEEGFYLAGGTGLALQIGHRTSLDFDFYTPQEYLPAEIYQQHLKQHHNQKQVELVKMTKNWLNTRIDSIEVTHFIYPYSLIEPLIETPYLKVASSLDIAAMKLIALVQRGTFRDFIDIYFLIQEFTLKTLLSVAQKKYTGYDVYLFLRALLYFEDAEKDARRKETKMLIQAPSWREIKKFLQSQVFAVQKEL
ncbi:MAG: nucleotidyl transferase AbiEii/AbiGii toxin family protein [Patescibacteria group bacterium]